MKKVLIIEDDAEIGEKIYQILHLEGLFVVHVDNGTSGIEKALEINPDLIICDIMMPGIDGYQVLEEIRKTHYIPFLFLSAKADKKDIRKGMVEGADDYLTKPFLIEDLLDTVKSCLRKKDFIEEGVKTEIEKFQTEIKTIQSKEKLLHSILNATHDIVTILHCGTGLIIFFNNRLKKLFPTVANNDKPFSILELIHPEDRDIANQILSKVNLLKDEQELAFEYRIKLPNGNYLFFLNRVSIFKRDNIGNPLLVLSILQDISEQKEKMQIIENFYERISDDLSLANSTQAELITLDFPKFDNIQFHIFYRSMEKVGGDFLASKELENGNLDIFAGDVSGHGISSSLVSAMAIVAFRMLDSKAYQPNEILFKLHESLSSLVQNHFISAVYIRLAVDSKILTLSFAGHPPLLLIRKNKVELLQGVGMFLILHSSPTYTNYTVNLQKGDKILLFSDGFYEAFNPLGKILSLDSFIEWVREFAHKPIEQLIHDLVERTLIYSNNVVNDDMTLFGFEYK